MPTLPAVMLQAKAMPVTSDFLEIAVEAGVEGLEGIPRSAGDIHRSSDLLRLMQTLRRQIQGRPSAVSNILERIRNAERTQPPERARLLRALADLYSGESIRHLNFYGPPGTVCTIPYHIALGAESDSRCAIEGAIVFVGLASASVGRAGQPDTYHTAYPSSGGIELSGVEIQATALANLLTGTALRPAGAFLLIAVLTGVGVTLGSTAYWVRTRRRAAKGAARCRWKAATVVVALTIAYCGVAHLVFRSYYEVLPVVVPVLVQLPVALVLGLLAPPVRHRQQVHAVCLATDAGGSTAVGQRLPHSEYAQLMEDYRQLLVKAVVAHGGDPIPPEGDGLVCVWSGPPASGGVRGIDPVLRLRACQAALEIAESTERFNQEHMPDRRLPTRIGLAMGVVTIRSDADRGVFEIVGDTVNIAARLRDLNRDLGSRVLASADVIEGLEARLSWRPIPDTFTLKGVGRQPTVVEVTGALRIAGRDAATSRDTPTAPEPM
jgi:adenylate cyclase